MNSAALTLRSARPEDWPQIREICCQTAADSHLFSPERKAFFPHIWIRPYEELLPEWTLVAARGSEVAGYLTGCPNTSAHRIARFWRVQIPIAWELLRGRHVWTPDVGPFLKRSFRIRAPIEHAFGFDRLLEWDREYPAHLHINFRTEFRGQGLGRQLVESYFARLRAHDIAGCHLYCGEAPAPFYESVGFRLLKRIELKPGLSVLAYGRKS